MESGLTIIINAIFWEPKIYLWKKLSIIQMKLKFIFSQGRKLVHDICKSICFQYVDCYLHCLIFAVWNVPRVTYTLCSKIQDRTSCGGMTPTYNSYYYWYSYINPLLMSRRGRESWNTNSLKIRLGCLRITVSTLIVRQRNGPVARKR